MAIGVGVLVGALTGGLAKVLSLGALRFIATKALLYTLFILILPVVLYNLFTTILNETLQYISSYASGEGISGVMVELTGVAAYLGSHLNLPQALSLVLSAAGLHFVIHMIRG